MTLPASVVAPVPEPLPTDPVPEDAGDGDRPRAITITPWPDPVIDTVGHDPRSLYVERFWLGVLGPTTVLLFRQLAMRFDDDPDGYELDLSQTAATLGLAGRERR